MLFNSVDFLIFFPIVTLIYFLIPHKIRYIWLLVCSYYFYMCWNAQYALLLFASTFVTWLSGIALDRTAKKEQDDPARTRSKGIVAGEGTWYEFDMVPGEWEIRERSADVTGKLVVIGSELKQHEIEELFKV